MTQPEISIIIPHLNDAERLELCLAALAGQAHPIERAEIIVVDNGSHEPPRALVARFPNAIFVEESIPGPGPARNRGVMIARAPILAFTDSDCIPDRGWTAAILARFGADPGLAAIGGEVRIFVAKPGRPSPAEAFEMLYAFRQESQIARMKFSATANLAVRREVFEAVGRFKGIDTVEDLDWGQRAARFGFVTRYAREMVVHHPARADMAALKAQWDRHTSHHFRLRAGSPAARVKWALTALAMAASPLFEVPHIFGSEKFSSSHERWMALRGLTKIRLYRAQRMLASLVDMEVRSASVEWNRK
jgi:GT2 family glycosyltransferase